MKDLIDYQRFQVEALQKRICELESKLKRSKKLTYLNYVMKIAQTSTKQLLNKKLTNYERIIITRKIKQNSSRI
jgi:hypothetical protein